MVCQIMTRVIIIESTINPNFCNKVIDNVIQIYLDLSLVEEK
jgi:hypothetical protein